MSVSPYMKKYICYLNTEVFLSQVTNFLYSLIRFKKSYNTCTLYLDRTHDKILHYNTSLMIQILSCVPALKLSRL